ncbi:MAG: tRNA (guanosine(37)-N1)-methyltransferase TrmD [Ruminococcus sp.]|nr:tRNA (guanosine(37)-N1)-methyltransferase TrmD [Ruminococcus sp.]
MRFDIATLFPEMCNSVLGESILGRAKNRGFVEFYCHNIRDFSKDKHRRVDDIPYGGGMGMVMQCEPIYNCWEYISNQIGEKPHTIYMSPKGSVLTQQKAIELSQLDNICILCGHYEGVDQRILDTIVDEEISIGDYVLTGGELPALVLVDTVTRLCDGVLASDECFQDESHFNGLLEYPQYTRPEVWKDMSVPSVLLSGHHKNIADWRREQSLKITKECRLDMYNNYIKNKE